MFQNKIEKRREKHIMMYKKYPHGQNTKRRKTKNIWLNDQSQDIDTHKKDDETAV